MNSPPPITKQQLTNWGLFIIDEKFGPYNPWDMRKIVLLIWIVLCVASPGIAATLSGTVRDSEGAAIPMAHVVIHWDSAGSNYLKDNIGAKEDKIATPDENGQFSLDLLPGFYDVFVSAPAFSPHCEKVRLSGKGTKKFGVKLKVSPVTLQELD